MKKQIGFKTRGMNRDLSVSAFNPEFAFENKNLRLSTNTSNTLMSWVNEKGTLSITLSQNLTGTPVGTAVLNHQLVIFTHSTGANPDYIYKLVYSNTDKTAMTVTQLYNGNLKFNVKHPLETLPSYEAETIQKIYWTDNLNQPRVINIAADSTERSRWNDTTFDFVNELQLKETVTIEKKLGASGMFAPGVIQYAFTYYHKYGQETNIFYTSPLQYISYRERGASPEDKVENAFQITVNDVDTNFDYLRIYSIQRTSIDATPIVKRIQDISTSNLAWVDESDHSKGKKASYLDTGMSGNSVEPTELLFKGGEQIVAKTIEQKDNTLFLGNIKTTRHRIEPTISSSIPSKVNITQLYRKFFPTSITTGNYVYANQLTAYKADSNGNKTSETVPCAGFKAGDTYRLGIQFQHYTGKWSDPVMVGDHPMPLNQRPVYQYNSGNPYIQVPVFHGNLSASGSTIIQDIYDAGYRRARAVVVFPGIQDRDIICQGVVASTLFTNRHRNIGTDSDNDLYAQSSWFFRTGAAASVLNNKTVWPQGSNNGTLPYTSSATNYDPSSIRAVEIQGQFDINDKFNTDQAFCTLHSPDIEFDDSLANIDYVGVSGNIVGSIDFIKTLSDINIQTETPTISNNGSGFVHKSFADRDAFGIVAGLFYDDYLVDDVDDGKLESWKVEKSPVKWMVYPWHKTGSLNNDINRPADKGVASAILKKKVISNLRIADTSTSWATTPYTTKIFNSPPQLFNSNENTILKLGDKIYRGNIDTVLMPDDSDGLYFAFGDNSGLIKDGTRTITGFNYPNIHKKTFAAKVPEGDAQVEKPGIWSYVSGTGWSHSESDMGEQYTDLVVQKGSVRMKYKSTPHLVMDLSSAITPANDMAVLEIVRDSVPMRFGGNTPDALKENIWLPCGEPVSFNRSDTSVQFDYSYGDTYFQRYDCLKTYAYTPEDINQVVEIGSFMLETRVNIDGRYDRNRGQQSNLYMSPQNFNLINPIYSQKDNFFTYRIQDEDYYTRNTFPNQLTWTLTKESGADVDQWTNITLASVMELDGDKGKINKLTRFNNQLVAFQDTGISHILYNDNVLIATANGVPIEIANSGKVSGKDYKSNTVGCSNKWSLVNTPMGIYFMDSNEKSIYLFNGQLLNLSDAMGFNSWCKKTIPSSDIEWDAQDFDNFITYYDKINQDILFILDNTTLAYSEKLKVFTSFYDYSRTPYFCNLDDTGIWIRGNGTLWKHQANSAYCNFFGTPKPYWMTLIGNPEPLVDKIFTNLEFRATIDTDGTVSSEKFTPLLPFDTLESWNEYQHGSITLQNKSGHEDMQHDLADKTAPLKRKFRIWRCDVPRDNMDVNVATETPMGIFRKAKHPIDRMRNPWLYLKLTKDAENNMQRVEMHDLMMTYFT